MRKTLPLLHDLERSVTIYDEFKQLVEKGRKQWNPGKTTQAIWQKVLALDEDEAG